MENLGLSIFVVDGVVSYIFSPNFSASPSISLSIKNGSSKIFSEETAAALREYGEVLRDIHNRMISEGYVFHNGEFYKKEG